MSSEPTLVEVKRMLDEMLSNTQPKQPKQQKTVDDINKQQRIDEILEKIQTDVIQACVTSGTHLHIIQLVLENFRKAGKISKWVVNTFESMTLREGFEVKINFPYSLTNYFITIYVDILKSRITMVDE
jgi:hypothetical protein